MTEPFANQNAKISIAFVNSIFVRRDAISNTLYDRVLFAAANQDLFDYKVFCYASDYPTLNVETVHNALQIVKSPEFSEADVVVIEFGIYHDLFDVVLCDTPAPKIVSYHNVTSSHLFEPGERRALCERSELQSWNLAFADHVICNSRFTLEQALRYGVDKERTSIIAPSVPVTGDVNIEKDQTGPVTLLYVGRLVPQKGIHDLIKAFSALSHMALPEWKLNVVGAMKFSDPNYVKRLRADIEENGLTDRINFLGELSETDIKQAFADAHVLVTPSYHEGFGVPVIEALASGCVVICSDAGSLPEVAGTFGRVFPCGDSRALAKKIAQALSDLRPRSGKPKYRLGSEVLTQTEYYAAAKSYVGPYLPEQAVKQFYDVLRKIAVKGHAKKLAASARPELSSVGGVRG